MGMTICNWAWRLLIGGVLLWAAYSKWQEGISYFPPESIYDRIVAMTPWRHYAVLATESLMGLWVLSGIRPRWGALGSGVLLIAFSVMLAVEIFRESPALCGCGISKVYAGGDPRIDLAMGIARNLLLLAGCGWLWLMSHDEPRVKA